MSLGFGASIVDCVCHRTEQRGAASLRDDLNGVVHEVRSYFDSRASGGTSFKWKDGRIDVRHRADALVPYTVRMLGNLEMALREESRPGASRKQSGKEEALLVATACSGPPAGRDR